MKFSMKRLFASFLFVLVLLLLFGTCPVHADDFPTQTIRVEVPWGAGSNTDAIAMMVTPYLEKELGENIVPVYKKGGGGVVGTAWLANQSPDGYSILAIAPGPIVVKPYLMDTQYTYDDFEPIAQVCVYPTVMVTQKNSDFEDMDDLIEQARKNPGKITYSTSGKFGMAHMTMEVIQEATGVEFKHIPYEGGGEAMAALRGGHVDLCGTELRGTIGKDDTTRILFSTTEERLPGFPDVPTVKEKGYDIVSNVWVGFMAPKGTPPERISILEQAIKTVSENEELREKIKDWGPTPEYLSSTEFDKKVKKQIEMFKGPIKRIK